ncbi:MAG: YgaP family membrane protein [Minisyncoccia bacterium]|jgi:hypothetical protein
MKKNLGKIDRIMRFILSLILIYYYLFRIFYFTQLRDSI